MIVAWGSAQSVDDNGCQSISCCVEFRAFCSCDNSIIAYIFCEDRGMGGKNKAGGEGMEAENE